MSRKERDSNKTLGWRLFGWGSVPRKLRPALEAEGIRLLEEGLPGRFVTRRLKAPGRRYRFRREGFSGCIAVTGTRLLLCSYRKLQVNIGLDDPRLRSLHVTTAHPGWLTIWFESARFHDDWRGVIEFRLKTANAAQIKQELISLGLSPGRPS